MALYWACNCGHTFNNLRYLPFSFFFETGKCKAGINKKVTKPLKPWLLKKTLIQYISKNIARDIEFLVTSMTAAGPA